MVSISTGSDPLTLVKVFTVDPQEQGRVASRLLDATLAAMRDQPGLVSASIHRSFDGRKIVNYAQWQSRAAFEATQRHAEGASRFQSAATIPEAEASHRDAGASATAL